MTVATSLARAAATGVRVEAEGDRLRLTAQKPASPALIHELAGAKAEIVAFLVARAANEAAERVAIQAEPPLPSRGALEREQLDQAQHATVAGLLAAAAVSRRLPSKKNDARNGQTT